MSFNLYSIEFEIENPCTKKIYFEKKDIKKVGNVGEFTIDFLKRNKINFVGNEQGLNSVFNTVIGMDALEVISDYEMRAYGWCFKVDDMIAEDYPNKIQLNENSKVNWYLGFAHYLNGEWVSQCEKISNDINFKICN